MSEEPLQFVQGGCGPPALRRGLGSSGKGLLAWAVMVGACQGRTWWPSAHTGCVCVTGAGTGSSVAEKQSGTELAAFPGAGASSPSSCFACPQLAVQGFVCRGNAAKSPSKEGWREPGTPSAPQLALSDSSAAPHSWQGMEGCGHQGMPPGVLPA